MKKVGLLLLLVSQAVRADIVFVDLNNSPLEVETARAAAKARKEQLVVYPLPGERDRERERLNARVTQLSKRVFSGALSEVDRRKYETDLREARSALSVHSEGLNAESLGALLKKLKSQGKAVTSLILSGHDGNGSFFGSNGRITSGDLNEALKSDPSAADKIRSLYLWGCYTANFGACQGHWKSSLPNLGIIVGFDGSAPAGDKPANHAYLKDALQKESKFIEAKDAKTVDRLFKSLNSVNHMHASICVGDVVTSSKGTFNSKQMTEQCKKVFSDKKPKAWADRISCYRDASKGCEDVPADTRQGELRKIYEEVQGAKHCQQMARESEDPELRKMADCWPDAAELLRLVLYKQVSKNFTALHAGEIAAYDKALAELKLTDSVALKDPSALSRAQLHERLTNASIEAERQISKAENFGNLGAMRASEVLERNASISKTLSRLNSFCVSEHWVEPAAKEKSKCMKNVPPGGSPNHALKLFSKQVDKEIGLEMTKRVNELRKLNDEYATEYMSSTATSREDAARIYVERMEKFQKAVTEERAAYTEKKIAYMKSILESGRASSKDYADSAFFKNWNEETFRQAENENAFQSVFESRDQPPPRE